MHHRIEITDVSIPKDSVGQQLKQPTQQYLVVNPLLKSGRPYEPGQKIELTKQTADNFLEVGDIKEIK